MANVKVCDICGEKLPTIWGGYSPSVRYRIKRVGLMTTEYDLCSTCMKEMSKWIKVKTEESEKARVSNGSNTETD